MILKLCSEAQGPSDIWQKPMGFSCQPLTTRDSSTAIPLLCAYLLAETARAVFKFLSCFPHFSTPEQGSKPWVSEGEQAEKGGAVSSFPFSKVEGGRPSNKGGGCREQGKAWDEEWQDVQLSVHATDVQLKRLNNGTTEQNLANALSYSVYTQKQQHFY